MPEQNVRVATLEADDTFSARFLPEAAATKDYVDGVIEGLSGVTNAVEARAALDLGSAATMEVGTAVGTVAAGDDPRFPDGYLTYRPSGGVAGSDTNAFHAQMVAAAAAGRAFHPAPGTHKIGQLPIITTGSTWVITGPTVIECSNTSDWAIRFRGSEAASTLLTADLAYASHTLMVASTAGWAADDIVLVSDDSPATNLGGTATPSAPNGQMFRVLTVDSDTQVTLSGPCYRAMTVANAAKARKINALPGVNIIGGSMLTFKNVAGASTTGGFVEVMYSDGCHLDFAGVNAKASGVLLKSVWRPRVVHRATGYQDQSVGSAFGITPVVGYPNQFGYGVECSAATCHGEITVYAEKCRHAFATTGWAGLYGEPFDIVVSGVSKDGYATAWDAHAPGSHILFKDCVAEGGRGYAFALRGKDQHILGGSFVNTFGGVWLFDHPGRNVIRSLTGRGVKAADAGWHTAGTNGGYAILTSSVMRDLRVDGCDFSDIALSGVRDKATTTDVLINNTVFRNIGQAGTAGENAGVYVTTATSTRWRIRNCRAEDDQATRTTAGVVSVGNTSIRDVDVANCEVGTPVGSGTMTPVVSSAAAAYVRQRALFPRELTITNNFSLRTYDLFGVVIHAQASQNWTVTVQDDTTMPGQQIGDWVQLRRTLAGTLTIAAGAGVTLNIIAGKTAVVAQYGTATLTKTAANVWALTGDLL
jgi:hypothetical protein